MKIAERIVSEISKTWHAHDQRPPFLREIFEVVIRTNQERGYRLESWNLSQHAQQGSCCVQLVETIIAVFVFEGVEGESAN